MNYIFIVFCDKRITFITKMFIFLDDVEVDESLFQDLEDLDLDENLNLDDEN